MIKFIIIIVGLVIAFFIVKWALTQLKGSPDQPNAYLRQKNQSQQS